MVKPLSPWLGAPEQAGLRRASAVWIKRVLLPARLPGASPPAVGDRLEINTMLAESVNEWTQDWKRQGILEGEFTLLERLLGKCFGPLTTLSRARRPVGLSVHMKR